MIGLRFLAILSALLIAGCVAAYLVSSDKKYLRWAFNVFKFAAAGALLFFAVLIVERIL